MQAFALVTDALLATGGHAVVMRQVYNKTKTFLEWSARRIGATVSAVDDGDHAALAAAITPATRFVFAETFTNPLMRAQDIAALVATIRAANPATKLVIDSTIATPWAFRSPLLAQVIRPVAESILEVLGSSFDEALGAPKQLSLL